MLKDYLYSLECSLYCPQTSHSYSLVSNHIPKRRGCPPRGHRWIYPNLLYLYVCVVKRTVMISATAASSVASAGTSDTASLCISDHLETASRKSLCCTALRAYTHRRLCRVDYLKVGVRAR